MSSLLVREMTIDDYDAVYQLWQNTPGVGLSSADSREAIAAFLGRNAGCSAVVTRDDQIVGALLCGHDGRRGFLHHLVVAPAYRRLGIARLLVNRSLAKLQNAGIEKCNVLLFKDNDVGFGFYERTGWSERQDLRLLQRVIPVSTDGSRLSSLPPAPRS